ncbi:unnamed protein product [Prorocentrum cordatum]|uniref:Uncharacterized protein n=1 Tax=Prorocentrum cordatum TaxID=2364126 RepID=A0ABN9RH80_9DINO|nr:unnamed protein product [Polarella glacialis]
MSASVSPKAVGSGAGGDNDDDGGGYDDDDVLGSRAHVSCACVLHKVACADRGGAPPPPRRSKVLHQAISWMPLFLMCEAARARSGALVQRPTTGPRGRSSGMRRMRSCRAITSASSLGRAHGRAEV